MESDRDWTARAWQTHDVERGPVSVFSVRARFPGQRWRQVARVGRAKSEAEQYEAMCREVSGISEPHVEVQAFAARGRQPETTRSPWTTGLSGGDAVLSAVGDVDDIDTDGDSATVAMRFARATMRAHELERGAIMQLLARQVDHARGETEYWRQAAIEAIRLNGGQVPPTIAATQEARPALAGEVIHGLQALGSTVMLSLLGGEEGPLRASVAAFFESLDGAQLNAIAGVLNPTQASHLLSLAAMAAGRPPPASSAEGEGEGEVLDV